MSIENIIKNAIEEFGDRAFERFVLNNNGTSKLKPLPELFAHDVDVYGDNSYFMWRYTTKYGAQPAKSNVEINRAIEYGLTISRSTSADNIEFDIDRARSGDAVQIISSCCENIRLVDVIIENVDGELCFRSAEYKSDSWFKCEGVYSKKLRMKYPALH